MKALPITRDVMSAPALNIFFPAPHVDLSGVAYAEGLRLKAAGDIDGAVAALDVALKHNPAFPEALRVGGELLRDRGAHEAALRFFGEALRLRPGFLEAALDAGLLLRGLYRFKEALHVYVEAYAHNPGNAALLTNIGISLHDLGLLGEADGIFRKAVAADPRLPQAHLNHANVLARMGDHAQALPIYERALALRPIYPAAQVGRGLALKMLGRFDEAELAFESALAQDGGNPYALANRGELRLLRGDYTSGLPDYEHRLRTEWQDRPMLAHPAPIWGGQPAEGKRIVMIADQGAGDVLNFVRYVPRLAATGVDVTLLCRPAMQRVISAATAGVRVVDSVEDERFDYQLPFSSAPYAFGSTEETIPSPGAYLTAEPDRVKHWSLRLGRFGFRIGLCWRGSQDWRADPNRSIDLRAFKPLSEIPGVRLMSLQMEPDPAAEDVRLECPSGIDRDGNAFVDTAAIIANCHLVVTCDTSIAHLAGALGAPAYVLLQQVPEWRWMLTGDTTPWYASMRLFRQEQPKDWSKPIADIAACVRMLMADRASA